MMPRVVHRPYEVTGTQARVPVGPALQARSGGVHARKDLAVADPHRALRVGRISTHVKAPLSSVAFHHDTPCITRWIPDDFPMHMAVHNVSVRRGSDVPAYVEPHTHEVIEVNILIPGSTDFEFEITLGDEVHRLRAASSIWIPPGVVHSARAVAGRGHLVFFQIPADDPASQNLRDHLRM